ncbi:hypothetical protein MJO29_012782 [Puccinia striiformis f. sp. tritici]|nr:hypothetical protein MJO29_012782 [Puccinia striiformis f. sp. tritici]
MEPSKANPKETTTTTKTKTTATPKESKTSKPAKVDPNYLPVTNAEVQSLLVWSTTQDKGEKAWAAFQKSRSEDSFFKTRGYDPQEDRWLTRLKRYLKFFKGRKRTDQPKGKATSGWPITKEKFILWAYRDPRPTIRSITTYLQTVEAARLATHHLFVDDFPDLSGQSLQVDKQVKETLNYFERKFSGKDTSQTQTKTKTTSATRASTSASSSTSKTTTRSKTDKVAITDSQPTAENNPAQVIPKPAKKFFPKTGTSTKSSDVLIAFCSETIDATTAQDSTTDDTQLNTEKHTLKTNTTAEKSAPSTSKIVTRSKIDKVVTTDSQPTTENNPSQVDILKPAKKFFPKTGTSTKSSDVLIAIQSETSNNLTARGSTAENKQLDTEKHSDKTNTTAVKSATITSKIITESKTDKVATTDTQPTTENNPPQVIAKPAERFFPKTGTSTKSSDALVVLQSETTNATTAQDSTTDDTQLDTEKHTLKTKTTAEKSAPSASQISTKSKIDKLATTDSQLTTENNPSQVDIPKPAEKFFPKTGTSTKLSDFLNTFQSETTNVKTAKDSTTEDTQLDTEKNPNKINTPAAKSATSISKIITTSKIDKVVTTDSQLTTENNPSQVDIPKPAEKFFPKTGTSTKSSDVLNTFQSETTNTTTAQNSTTENKQLDTEKYPNKTHTPAAKSAVDTTNKTYPEMNANLITAEASTEDTHHDTCKSSSQLPSNSLKKSSTTSASTRPTRISPKKAATATTTVSNTNRPLKRKLLEIPKSKKKKSIDSSSGTVSSTSTSASSSLPPIPVSSLASKLLAPTSLPAIPSSLSRKPSPPRRPRPRRPSIPSSFSDISIKPKKIVASSSANPKPSQTLPPRPLANYDDNELPKTTVLKKVVHDLDPKSTIVSGKEEVLEPGKIPTISINSSPDDPPPSTTTTNRESPEIIIEVGTKKPTIKHTCSPSEFSSDDHSHPALLPHPSSSPSTTIHQQKKIKSNPILTTIRKQLAKYNQQQLAQKQKQKQDPDLEILPTISTPPVNLTEQFNMDVDEDVKIDQFPSIYHQINSFVDLINFPEIREQVFVELQRDHPNNLSVEEVIEGLSTEIEGSTGIGGELNHIASSEDLIACLEPYLTYWSQQGISGFPILAIKVCIWLDSYHPKVTEEESMGISICFDKLSRKIVNGFPEEEQGLSMFNYPTSFIESPIWLSFLDFNGWSSYPLDHLSPFSTAGCTSASSIPRSPSPFLDNLPHPNLTDKIFNHTLTGLHLPSEPVQNQSHCNQHQQQDQIQYKRDSIHSIEHRKFLLNLHKFVQLLR